MRSAALAVLLSAAAAQAAVKTKVIEYDSAGTKAKGFLAYDDAATGKKPGVVVFHEWWGLDGYAKMRAEKLAELGYVAFCADLYGDGKTTEHPEEAGKFAGEVRKNQEQWLARGKAAVAELKKQPQVDGDKVAAIGYCFGGTTALVLAFAGEDLKAVAAFHAMPPGVTESQAKASKAKILVCHGGADTFIPETAVNKFKETLDKAGTKYEFISYPGVTHSFTVKGVEKKMPVLKYDEDADKKSWESMKALFKETLGS